MAVTIGRARRLASMHVLVLAVAGCSAPLSSVDGQREPALGPVPGVVASAGLRLPVEEYLSSAEQNDRLARATVVLVRACLTRFGFGYDVQPVPSDRYGPASLTDRRYGVSDLDLARVNGYGLGERDPARAELPDRPDLGPDGRTALTGRGPSVVNGVPVPSGGCLGEAERALDPPGDLRKGGALQFESYAQSRVDSRVQAAFAAWSVCMAGAGYPYTDPMAAAADPAFSGPLDQHQIDVATMDIGCKARTNLVGIWYAVESAYQRRAIDADPSGFAATRAGIEARDRLAVTVLGG